MCLVHSQPATLHMVGYYEKTNAQITKSHLGCPLNGNRCSCCKLMQVYRPQLMTSYNDWRMTHSSSRISWTRMLKEQRHVLEALRNTSVHQLNLEGENPEFQFVKHIICMSHQTHNLHVWWTPGFETRAGKSVTKQKFGTTISTITKYLRLAHEYMCG